MDEPAIPQTPFKDRTAGLVIFGILTILLGCGCALLVPLMFFGASMSEMRTGSREGARMIVPSVAMYGGLAVAFVWLGVGSLLRKRWARALLLVLSWGWLVTGVLAMAFSLILMPGMLATFPAADHRQELARQIGAAIALAFLGVFFVVVPACWVLFYRSRHVKATCEARHPAAAWTDRCPLPVLGLSVAMAAGVPMMFVMPWAYNGVLPFFGMFLTGAAGMAAYLVLGVAWAYGAWAIYRLDRRAWRWLIAVIALFGISGFLTYVTHSVSDIYSHMGLPGEEVARIQAVPGMSSGSLAWLTLASCAVMIGYTAFVGRYFKNPSAAQIQP